MYLVDNGGFDKSVEQGADCIALGVPVRRNPFSTRADFTTDALVGLLEVQITDPFRFGYAYDYTMNNIRVVAPSSHEIMLRYEFGFGKIAS